MKTKLDYKLNYAFDSRPISIGDIKLYRISKTQCTLNSDKNAHAHIDWFELTAIISGKGKIWTNNVSTDVEAGDIYFSFPCDIHRTESSEEEPLEFLDLSFNTENILLTALLDEIVEKFPDSNSRVIKNNKIISLINDVNVEFTEKNSRYEDIVYCLIRQIIVLTARCFSEMPDIKAISNQSKHDKLCYKIMKYIDSNIYDIKSLTELCDEFSYNYSYLSHAFKITTGQTISDYYCNKKLDISKLLITEKKLKFSEIATLLNYSSIYSFSKAFKEKFKMSPSEYAKSIKF